MDSMGFLLVIFLITRNSEKSWELGGSGELGGEVIVSTVLLPINLMSIYQDGLRIVYIVISFMNVISLNRLSYFAQAFAKVPVERS